MKTIHALAVSKRIPWILVTILACTIFAMSVLPATAQKSKKPQPVQTTQSSLKEVLAQYQGKTTNLGTLSKVAGDYFVLEEDGVTSMHPLAAIHTLNITKDEDAGTTKLEIKLIARE
jgi:hypothetical protein